MAEFKKATEEEKSERIFIGKAWNNTSKTGKEYLGISISREFAEITLKPGDKIQMWPNNKREGKNDADYSISIVK